MEPHVINSLAVETEFQTSRRMFVIFGDCVIVAEPGKNWSHSEWLIRSGLVSPSELDEVLETVTRGFWLPGEGLFAYRGLFVYDEALIADLERHIDRLAEVLELPEDAEIVLGPKNLEVSGELFTQHRLGKLSDLGIFGKFQR